MPADNSVFAVRYAYPNAFGTSQIHKPLAAHCRHRSIWGNLGDLGVKATLYISQKDGKRIFTTGD